MRERLLNQRNLTRRLHLLSVLCAMLLMPLGAWAVDYPIVVAGVQVTDANAGNVLGDGETATVVFTPAGDAPATLTLNGATLYGSIVLQSGLDDLTIHLLGENKIQGTDYQNPLANGIKRENGTTTGTLTYTTASGASGTLFFPYVTTPIEGFNDIVYNNGLEWGCDSYVEDNKVCTNFYEGVGTNVVLASASWQDCITKSQTMLSLTNGATITFREDNSLGRVLTLSGFTDYSSSICWYSHSDVKFEISGTNSFKFDGNPMLVGNDQSNVSFIATGTSAATLRFWHKGNGANRLDLSVPFISGFKNSSNPGLGEGLYNVDVSEPRIDPDNNYTDDFTEHYITTEAYGLKVSGVRVHNLDGVYKGHKEHILGEKEEGVFNTSVTFAPATTTLTLNGAEISHLDEENAIISSLSTPLYVHLLGENTLNCNSYLPFEGATGDDANLVFTTTTDADPGSLTLISSHENFGKTTFYTGFNEVQYPENSGSLGAKEESGNVIISQIQSYGLSIAGIPVTSENAGGITGDGITGTVTYNAEDHALTLDGATIAGNILVTSGTALTIKVKGENTINAGEYSALKSETATNAVTLAFVKEGTGDCSLQLNSTGVTAISTGFYSPTYTDLALVVDGVDFPEYNTLYGLAYYAGNNTYEPITSATITSYTTYDLIVDGEQVTSVNKDAICKGQVGVGHITFDGEHTLTLNEVPYIVFDTTYPFIQTSMDLTINIVGESTIECGSPFITRMSGDNETHTVTFTTDATDPGMLNLMYDYDFDGFDKAFENGLSWMPDGYYESDAPAAWVAVSSYDLSVGGVAVTSANAENVLGDGKVNYDVENHTLTLNNATIIPKGEDFGITYNGTANFTISLKGTNNVVKGIGGCCAILYNGDGDNVNLTFTKGDTEPCSLQLEAVGAQTIDGFDNVINTGLFKINETIQGEETTTYRTTITSSLPLWIGDTQVTPTNAEDMLGDGKVSFEVNAQTATPTYTLTLNGAVLTVPVKVGLANLTFDIRGNNTITTNTTCIQNTASTGVPSLTFKSNADVVGSLIMTNTGGDAISQIGQGNISISKELAVFLTVYGYDDYTSNLYYITDGSTTVAKIVPSYGVTVNDIQVYEGNAEDVLGDGKVSFNEKTATLTLKGGSFETIRTTLGTLNINFVGSNSLYRSSNGSIFESASGEAVTINLKSTDGTGVLTIETPTNYGATIIGENVTLTPVAPVFESYNNVENNKGKLQYAVNSGITITAASGSYPINSSNRTNVLNDSEGHETVQFDGRNTLILNGAELTSINIANQHVLQKLVIYLKGTNTINNNDNNGIIYGGEGESKLPLTYATGDGSTEDSQPGTLTCTYHVEDAEHPEVMDIYDKFDVSYDNNLGESQNTTNHTINIAVVMSPIVTEGHHEVERQGLGQDIESKNTTQLTEGVIVNKLLYTLPGDKDGYIVDEDYVQVNGKVVALNTPMDDGEVNDILEYIKTGLIQPGTKLGDPYTFAYYFHGMSFLLPAGYGEISLDVNTNVNTNEAGILHVKVGSNEPVAITGTTGFETIKIPYALTEESYVFIYRYAPSTPLSRGDDGHRAPGRKETTTTGIRGLSVNANSVESSPEPPVSPKLLDKSLLKQDRNHIYIETEDAVDVEGIESDAFANLTGDITYIDLSNTAIKDILVDRKHSGSPFKDIPEKTFIYLPAGNTIAPSAPGHENKNVVIGSVCDKMEMDDSAPFEVAKDFIALDAKQTRTYTIGQNATIYLPFAINSETASALGTFYELTGIADGKVTFKSVEETEETKANTPYLFKPKTTTLSAKMAEVKTLTSAPYTGDARFIGRYSQKSILSTTTIQCYCFNAIDGKFVHVVDQPMTVDPFRAYIEVSGMSLGRSLEINTGDDDVTAIKNIKVGTEDNVYYDLQGRRVLYPKKGIYIVNGKKVILK